MIAQSTLISYHTEAFVKTESACTVPSLFEKKISSFIDESKIKAESILGLLFQRKGVK